MTNRYSYPTYWASGGVAIDPDTDTTAPSYIADRYAKIGWKAEKPPNEWDNYLYQITDEKIMWLLQEGLVTWDSTVNYAAGALTRTDLLIYKNISGANALNKPVTDPTVWAEIKTIDSATFVSAVTALQTALADHLAADNPHKDTIEGIGGVSSAYVDDAFGDPTDPRTIVYHKLQLGGAVHGETPLQVGTLPVAGGTFTGDIKFLQKVSFKADKSIYVQLNQATARAEMHMGSVTLSVDVQGNVFFNDGTKDYLIVTVSNFDSVQIKVNYQFTLPQSLAAIDVVSGSLSNIGCSPNILTTTSNAVWEAGKGLVLTGSGLAASKLDFGTSLTTAYIVGWNAAGLQTEVWESSGSNYSALETFLTTTCASKFTHLQSMIVYPRLTAYQKTTLVKYVTS